jgi:hypothetical protein
VIVVFGLLMLFGTDLLHCVYSSFSWPRGGIDRYDSVLCMINVSRGCFVSFRAFVLFLQLEVFCYGKHFVILALLVETRGASCRHCVDIVYMMM